ncbi:hypothetical protein ACIA8C_20755 [Nocardia sp. NPDC051321]
MTAARSYRTEPALIDNVPGALLGLLLLVVIAAIALSSSLAAASPF